jgi:hypothetical protein
MALDEWVVLPEDNSYPYELQEGILLASPRSGRIGCWLQCEGEEDAIQSNDQ